MSRNKPFPFIQFFIQSRIYLLAAIMVGIFALVAPVAAISLGHVPTENIGYTDGTHARAYTAAPNMRQSGASLNAARSDIWHNEATDLYVNFTFDTTGKFVYLVYTTDNTVPTKTNGSVVNVAFSKFNDPDRTWYVTLPAQAAGTQVAYVFYISDSDLASGWGRVSNLGYETSWTEGDASGFQYTVGRVINRTANTVYNTIQAGINAATAGDILEIAPGTYAENVVVDRSITLRGSGDGADPAVDTILDGTTAPGRGIFINTGITNVTIEDLRVVNYGGANGTGIYANGQNNNFTVQNVTTNNNGPGSISASGGIYMNGPVNTVLIDNVTAQNNWGRGIVIWNGLKTNITITNNDVRNNNCCGIELQDGTASGVTMTGNTVVDNADSGMSAIGLTSGAGANLIANNTVTDNGRFGIEIKLPNGTGLTSGDGSIVVENNTVSLTGTPTDLRDWAGIAVFRRGWVTGNNNVDIPTGVIVRNNSVSGYQQTNVGSSSDGFGIVVEGTNMAVTSNTLTNNDVGVQLQAGHLPYTANTNIDGDQSNLADQYFGRGNSPVGCAAVLNNTFSGNTTDTRNVGPVGGGTVINTNTAETFCSIQSAIDAASSNDTIEVSAGTYVEDLTIDKALTLNGPNAGINPNTGARVAEAIIQPATSNPDPAICSIMAYLETSSITIDGFTFDGDNPALTSGIMIGSADVDACEILAGYEGMGSTIIENNILQHSTYSGIDFYNDTNSAATSGNYIRYNLIRNIGTTNYSWGIGVLNYNNFYADVVDNVLENVRVGIQTGNYWQANPGSTGQISNNEINAWRLGIFHNLWYSAASIISVSNNTINAIDHATSLTWNGMLVSSWQNTANTLIEDNVINIGNITQLASGYNIWNTPTTAALTISGGSIDGGDYGIFVNNYDGYASDANNTSIIVDNVTISNAAIAGVYAKDNPSNTNSAIVRATIQNSTISSNATALLITGPDASITAKGNTINTHVNVLDLTDGNLLAYANNITNFTTGVNNTGGTLNGRHNWWGTHASQPTGVDNDSWAYRLGAPVASWGEGTLGAASLTAAGGSGTGVIVSHGRGLANVPFGKGNDPYASAMCSDYYDFFVLNAAGNWTVSVPTDAGAGCDDTRTNLALYQFALTSDQPDTACVGGACWEPPTGVSLSGNNLQVTVDADAILQGTPFVAGDSTPLSNDPTAVTLQSFSTHTTAPNALITTTLLLITILAGWAILRKRNHTS
jgi:hypothetical protein